MFHSKCLIDKFRPVRPQLRHLPKSIGDAFYGLKYCVKVIILKQFRFTVAQDLWMNFSFIQLVRESVRALMRLVQIADLCNNFYLPIDTNFISSKTEHHI